MNPNIRRTSLGSLILFTLACHPNLIQNVKAQQTQPSVRQRFVIVPAAQRCEPASVRFVSFGRQPPDALLAQVTVENGSDKVMTAVKLGWKVYSYPEGRKISLSYCEANSASGEVFLSGTTTLIELEALTPKATINISTNPLVIPTPATKTVFVDHPLLTFEDVKSLPLADPTPKIEYAVVMYVSEIHFADGTSWEARK